MLKPNPDRIEAIEAATWTFLNYWDGVAASERRDNPALVRIAGDIRRALTLPERIELDA